MYKGIQVSSVSDVIEKKYFGKYIICHYFASVNFIGARLQGVADQVNSYDNQHYAIKASDYEYSSFSWTSDSINAWWRIQLDEGPKLISKIELHNRPRNSAGTYQCESIISY